MLNKNFHWKKIKRLFSWRILCLLLGMICLIWFLIPWVVASILNIGNATGILLSVMLVFYALFMPKIHEKIGCLWQKKPGKWCLRACAGAASIIVLLVIIESACMIGACTKSVDENATAVVLGCRVYGERASRMLTERLESALEYLQENPDANCVVSGGQGPGEDISEAECMYRWLVDKGIEPERIYKEDKSTSTDENIRFSKEVIADNNLNSNVAIITNEFHVYRAGVIAEDNNLTWGAKPGHTAAWLFPTYYVRELYGILSEWIF